MVQALELQRRELLEASEVQRRESSRELRRRFEEERQVMLEALKVHQRSLRAEQEAQHALLVAKEGAEGDAMRQNRRAEILEQTVRERDAMIEPLKKLESELRDLVKEKERLTAQLQDALGKAEQDADLIGRLQAGVEETRTKEQRLRLEFERLQKEQAEKDALIATYQQAHRGGDPYTYLLDLINNKGCSDDELARQIYATTVRSGKQLGQLHSGDQPSLVVALMKVTRPYRAQYSSARIEPGSAGDQYKLCFRELGNQLKELGFGGDHIDFKTVRFEESNLAGRFQGASRLLAAG